MSTDVPALDLRSAWLNAAGSLGFQPDSRGTLALEKLGAFITNPISLRARRASQGTRSVKFPGGVLLHTGHPNPGLTAALKKFRLAWARAPLPIIIHLLAEEPAALHKAMPRIEELENLAGIELGIPADASAQLAAELVQAAAGELAVIAQLAIPRSEELAEAVLNAGASAISLGAPRGVLPSESGKLVEGRLYGAAIYPLALAAVKNLSKAGVAVIGAGGVETRAQGEAMLAAGAMAVQIDIALWKQIDL
jgi:dihydroorotate dehydrogenase (NAD+) catalytic subunit